MKLAPVMDEIALCMKQVAGLHVYAWPTAKWTVPAAVVSYPDRAAYREAAPGLWRLTLPLVLAFGMADAPATRDVLAAYLDASGPKAVCQLLDAYAWTSCDSVTATDADIDVVTRTNVDYLAAVFTLDIVGPK